ncbi:LysR family transcriptional regulator [Actinomycetospora termitidis]|uniref:LysR substrate-binding domain-containing protein n=1 Tax=Actinomycetospora termitidis TaxID=3053470 RepID=A0ABT7MEV4_9PSEU|nr:LysR substrate-binding domain-containing protein [Actinomycetospora sp. Odt1-22]MDL5157903.1 LysR substrate-binding domain-containing protein [Actinomycetospora sp. Odt1-22]
MDLRQLRYFVTVARTRHFGRAAQELLIAQSPLSQAIRQLESHLGTPLFERTTRRVDLTAAGEALLPEAVRILESVSAARDQVSRVAAGDLGALRVGTTALATYRHVPRLVRRLAAELPGVSLTFRTEMLTPALESALADHRIDLAVLRPPVRDETLAVHLLARERLVLAVGDDDPETGPVDLAGLADADFVVYSAPGSVVGAAAERACRAAGFVPRHTHEADQTSIVLALVAAGVGVALLPESVLAVAVAGVHYRELRRPAPGTADVALAWRRDDPSPALAKALAVLTADDPQPGDPPS